MGKIVDWILEYAWTNQYLQHLQTIKIDGYIQDWVREKWGRIFADWGKGGAKGSKGGDKIRPSPSGKTSTPQTWDPSRTTTGHILKNMSHTSTTRPPANENWHARALDRIRGSRAMRLWTSGVTLKSKQVIPRYGMTDLLTRRIPLCGIESRFGVRNKGQDIAAPTTA
jgi:hypothetical protein